MHITDHTYHEAHRIHTHHCDTLFSARLPYYFQAAQEGAATHAMLCGCSNPDFEKIGKAWVLSKIKMSVERYVPWSEEITLKTWIHPTFRFFAPREACGFDQQGNKLFRTLAYWVIINIETRRPEKPEQFLDRIGLSEDRTLWSDQKLGKVPRLPREEPTCTFTPQIQTRDIDSVRHVNNISYIEWILESMNLAYRDMWKPKEFEINFTSESFLSDKLEVRTVQTDEKTWLHSVIKNQDGEEVEACRARSTWKQRSDIT